jgi:hypothetical protein
MILKTPTCRDQLEIRQRTGRMNRCILDYGSQEILFKKGNYWNKSVLVSPIRYLVKITEFWSL